MGVDRDKMGDLLKLVAKLDKNFTKENWINIKTHITDMELKKLPWIIDWTLNKSDNGMVHIRKNSKVVEATSKVLLECEYLKQPCIVKVMDSTVDKIGLFVESIINIFMSAVIRDEVNEHISTPDILTMGVANSPITEIAYVPITEKSPEMKYILVQEKIEGTEFAKITDYTELRGAMKTLCMGLQILQQNYNFAHRDFHCGNVMYNPKINKVYIIDFGYACFSIPDTSGSLQHVGGGYGYEQFDKEYEAHRQCVNKSHDLCVLILSLLCQIPDDNERKTSIPWLYNLGQEISTRYKAQYAEKIKVGGVGRTTNWLRMHNSIRLNKTKKPFTFDKEIIHYWYLYEMFDIDIGMGPTEILAALNEAALPKLGPNQAIVYQPLKF